MSEEYLEILLRGDVKTFVFTLFERNHGRISLQALETALQSRFGYAMFTLVSDDRLDQMSDPIEGYGGFHYFPMDEDIILHDGYLIRGALKTQPA
ncbi:hypothetical protein J4410_00815 [Candidatus Woesearchaeota archaeon]|nr:hypothetical protein [Candidatus Woesearchaeota archaeon]